MSDTTEAFARVKIDKLLADAGCNLTDGDAGDQANASRAGQGKGPTPNERLASLRGV